MRMLMYFSYIGTNYRGLQSNIRKHTLPGLASAPDLDSIQGILEFGLRKVLRKERVPIFSSSRTDTKVHAVESTAAFDLKDSEWAECKRSYSPEILCQGLNLFLYKNECDIRIKRIIQVPDNFNSRRALSRVYEFRTAILNQVPHNSIFHNHSESALDIRDLNRCEVISQPFDIVAVQHCCKLFLGQWDFSTFMKASGEHVPPEKRIKTIRRFSFSPEVLLDRDSSFDLDLLASPYNIYRFTVEGSGFLRRQVRRMVGALVAVGRGNIKPADILWMLKNPNEQNWNPKATPLGPNGLFLKQVNYHPSNLQVFRGYLG